MVDGKKLKKLRKLKFDNQCELAEKAGVSQSLLSRLERDEIKYPRFAPLEKLAVALGDKSFLYTTYKEEHQMAETLKSLRHKKQMQQVEVARKVGITQAAYSQFELGQTKPRAAVRKKLEALFGQSIPDVAPTQKKKKKIIEPDGYIFFNVQDARLIKRALYWYMVEISEKLEERKFNPSEAGVKVPNIFMSVLHGERSESERVRKLLKEKLNELEELDE